MAYGISGVFGLLFGLTIVMRLDNSVFATRFLTLFEAWTLTASVIGVCVSLRIARDKLCMPSAFRTFEGMLLLTVLAPIAAGTLILPIYGTMFGPFTLALIFWALPITALVWLFAMIVISALLREWQRERDSIFPGQTSRPIARALQTFGRDLRTR